MLSGKTVEIDNTDAEGRLVLADGVTYALNKLNVVITSFSLFLIKKNFFLNFSQNEF